MKVLSIIVTLVVVEGQQVTGQNQNAGSETAQKMMRIAGGSER